MSSKLKQGNHINRKPEKMMGQRPLRNVWQKFYDKMCLSGTRYENRFSFLREPDIVKRVNFLNSQYLIDWNFLKRKIF